MSWLAALRAAFERSVWVLKLDLVSVEAEPVAISSSASL
jgi:hypothetical protein